MVGLKFFLLYNFLYFLFSTSCYFYNQKKTKMKTKNNEAPDLVLRTGLAFTGWVTGSHDYIFRISVFPYVKWVQLPGEL